MVTRTGFEPVYACVKGMCVKPLHQRAIHKWRSRRESNPRSPAWQAGMLTATPLDLLSIQLLHFIIVKSNCQILLKVFFSCSFDLYIISSLSKFVNIFSKKFRKKINLSHLYKILTLTTSKIIRFWLSYCTSPSLI